MSTPGLRALLGAAALAGAQSCATARPPPPPPAAAAPAPAPDPRQERLAEAEAAFAHRGERAELARAIAALEAAAQLADSTEVRLSLARAHGFAAMMAAPPERAAQLREVAAQARRALALAGVPEAEACATTAKPAAGALYWLAQALDGLSREAGLVAGAQDRRRALCLVQRAAELDPLYLHASPLRLLGALLARSPALSGGDAAASARAFDQAIAAAPEALEAHVERAATLCVKLQDRAAFERELEQVLSVPEGAGELAPENRLARERARSLKAQLGVLFK